MPLASLLTAAQRRLRLSRAGLGWLVLSISMLLTGLAKSINLITLLACVFLGAVLINLFLARRQTRRLRFEREPADFFLAGRANAWPVRVWQNSPRARRGIVIVDPWPGQPTARAFPLRAAAEQTCDLVVTPRQRGVFEVGPLLIHCNYPLGLAEVELPVTPKAVVHVAPRLGRIRRGALRRFLSQRTPTLGGVRTRPIRHPTGQMEFHGLRPFRPGDSPRHIHWRTSARRGELMVREFEEYPNDDLVLIVDLSAGPAGASAGKPAKFEEMLSLAASIVWEWCRQKGDWFTMIVAGDKATRIAGPTGQGLLSEAMRALAAAKPVPIAAAVLAEEALRQGPASMAAQLILSVGAGTLVGTIDCGGRPAVHIDVDRDDHRDFFDEGENLASPPDDTGLG